MKGRWKKTLHMVIRENNGSVANRDKRASNRTQKERKAFYTRCFEQLDKAGFHIENVGNLKEKHIRYLIELWEKSELSPATIQSYISFLRIFCSWINKNGMIRASTEMVSTPDKVRRTVVATVDKSWETGGITIEKLIQRMREINPRMAMVMRLARAFGLRLQEAYMFKPHHADEGTYIVINWGTKGGKRRRVVPIETQEQVEVLKEAKQFAATLNSSMIPDDTTYKTYRNRTRWHLDKIGLTKEKLGITFHGARHSYLNDRFETVSGIESPVRSGKPVRSGQGKVDLARQVIVEEAGHARPSISSAYLGHFLRPKNNKSSS